MARLPLSDLCGRRTFGMGRSLQVLRLVACACWRSHHRFTMAGLPGSPPMCPTRRSHRRSFPFQIIPRRRLPGFRRSSRRVAKQFRRQGWQVLGLFVVGFIGGVSLGSLVSKTFGIDEWIIPVFVALCAYGPSAWLEVTRPKPICPGCHEPLLGDLGPHCPSCGTGQLKPGGWLDLPRCTSCSRTFGSAGRRRYPVRACTHCGLFLGGKGV